MGGVVDWSAPSNWLSSVKLPPSGVAGSLSEGLSTLLFLLGDRVSRQTTFLRDRITLEWAGDTTVAAGWGAVVAAGGSGAAVAAADESAAVAAIVEGAALAA